MSQCGNHTNGTLFEGCLDFHLAYIYLIAVCSLLLIAIGLILSVVALRTICKKKRAKIVRQSTTRGSVRRSTHGNAYNIKTQEEQLQLPEYSTRFEYVDVLAESNNSISSQTHETDNAITTSLEEGHRLVQREDENGLSESSLPVNHDQVYDEPDTTELLDRRQKGRASCRSMQESMQFFQNGLETDANQHVSMRRVLYARESTRSMPGVVLRQASADLGKVRNSRSHKSQIIDVQSRVTHKQRARSMFDPLPDIPVGNYSEGQNQTSAPVIEIEQVEILDNTPKVMSCYSMEDKLTRESSLQHNVHDASEKQFVFEDGTFLGVDVPSFQDPEIISENGDLTNSVSIYSSQILSKFEEESGMDHDHEEDALDDTEEEEITLIMSTETEQGSHYTKLDHTSDHHKTVTFSADIESIDIDRSTETTDGTPVYSRFENQHPPFETFCSVNEDEVVYDDPVVIVKKPPEDENVETELRLTDIKDPANLFDFPGYAEGMIATQQVPVQAITQTGLEDVVLKEPPQLPALPRKPSDRMTPTQVKIVSGNTQNTFPRSIHQRAYKQQDIEYENEDSTQNMLSAQMKEVPGLTLSLDSMTIFDFKDDELNDLDPDIASCLITTDNDENQISYV